VGVAHGDLHPQTNHLFFLAILELRAGEWTRAEEYAEAVLQIGEQRGLEFQGGSALWIKGLVDAHVGRVDEARARAVERGSRSREEDDQMFLEQNLALLGLIELSTGDDVAAAERLARPSAGSSAVGTESRVSTRPVSSRSRRWSGSATSNTSGCRCRSSAPARC
jgi:hypothetical protein